MTNAVATSGTMRWLAGTALAVALLGGSGARAETATNAPSWPESRVGSLAKGWVESFDAGEPAMRRFLAENLSAADLGKKSVEARIESYRSLREKLGALELASVVGEDGDTLTVSLADAHGTEHEFEFQLEAEAPKKLATITARIQVKGHGLFPH
jgi:hypothetical protein